MNTKRIVLSAIIAALPFAANATQTIVQTQTPAAVGSDGTVKKAATSGPYTTIEPTVDDQTHIATTAYVKGAYNDAIAAVNKVDSDKQNQLYGYQNGKITGIQDADGFVAMTDDVVRQLLFGDGDFSDISSGLQSYAGNMLPTSASVATGIVVAAKVLNSKIDDKIDSKRVDIYTTWGNDTAAATTQVELSTIE